MAMPIKAFWTMNAQIARLRAEENLDVIELQLIGGQACTGEMIQSYRDVMSKRLGVTAEFREKEAPDVHAEGVSKLRMLLNI